MSKEERKRLKAMISFYENEQSKLNLLNDYKQGLINLQGRYKELFDEYPENKDNGSFIVGFIVWWFNVSIWFLLIVGYVAKNFLTKKKVLTTHGSAKWAGMENLLLGKDSQKPFEKD